jgi:hypothetical protein
LAENDTPGRVLRVRIVGWPKPGEVDEFDIRRRFAIGEVYELPVQLAATLIIAGYGQGVGPVPAEAADRSSSQPPRLKKR